MAKTPDYARAKALAKEFLECIGDDEEGENPSLPKQDNAIEDGGQGKVEALEPNDKLEDEKLKKKKKSDSASLAVMSSMLASKVGKSAVN